MSIEAKGEHYFGPSGFPVTARAIRGEEKDQHRYDLTDRPHYHDFSELVIITNGHGLQWIQGRDYPVSGGDVFLLKGREEHYFKARENIELYNVMFDPAHIRLPVKELKQIPGYHAMFVLEPSYRKKHRFESRLHLGSRALVRAETIAERMLREWQRRDVGYEAALLGMLVELMTFLAREYSQTRTTEGKSLLRIGTVLGALERDFTRSWSLAEMARIAHMSQNNLLRIFREATGTTPVSYLIFLRIQKAMHLLRNTDLPVTEVAYNAGFRDSNYFARQFRKNVGQSPSRYRSSFR